MPDSKTESKTTTQPKKVHAGKIVAINKTVEKVAVAAQVHVKGRPKYANYAEFLLSTIGYSVGLGNVWRFPQLAFEYGGGAFLIPYWIAVFLVGVPVYFLELCIGQYVSLGPCVAYANMAPIARGIGWAMFAASMVIITYYNMVIAWSIYYFFMSFRTELLWMTCRNPWNTKDCHSKREDDYCKGFLNDTDAVFYSQKCYNGSQVQKMNETLASSTKVLPADEFFNFYVLVRSDSFEEMGSLQWPLVGCLTLAWVLTALCLSKGVKTTGKAVYFAAVVPYFILFALFIRGVTLPGSSVGLYYYFVPEFSKLASIKPWSKAATQVFYSLNIATGGIITIASYMQFHNNCLRDAIIISLADTFTSIFSGCAIFSILGYMAYDIGVPVAEVTKSGPGLTFIAYPEAIVKMTWSSFWSIMFFFMLILLGLDSEFADMETCITSLLDEFPTLREYRFRVILIMTTICFLIGLIFCTNGGIYYFTLFDDYGAAFTLLFVSICELVVVAYIYGWRKFRGNVEEMLGSKPGMYWIISWCGTGPAYLALITVIFFFYYEASAYGPYVFSKGAEAAGWLLGLASLLIVPGIALYMYVKTVRAGEDWHKLFQPTENFRPSPDSLAQAGVPQLPSPRETPKSSSYGAMPSKDSKLSEGPKKS